LTHFWVISVTFVYASSLTVSFAPPSLMNGVAPSIWLYIVQKKRHGVAISLTFATFSALPPVTLETAARALSKASMPVRSLRLPSPSMRPAFWHTSTL
jgi:hypothetical protein